MGIDIGKNSFHVVGLDQRGAIVLRQKWSRGQVEARLANNAAAPDRHGSVRSFTRYAILRTTTILFAVHRFPYSVKT